MKAFNEWKSEHVFTEIARKDALEISNLAGLMLLKVEDFAAKKIGWIRQKELDDLGPAWRQLITELRNARREIADKLLPLIED